MIEMNEAFDCCLVRNVVSAVEEGEKRQDWVGAMIATVARMMMMMKSLVWAHCQHCLLPPLLLEQRQMKTQARAHLAQRMMQKESLAEIQKQRQEQMLLQS